MGLSVITARVSPLNVKCLPSLGPEHGRDLGLDWYLTMGEMRAAPLRFQRSIFPSPTSGRLSSADSGRGPNRETYGFRPLGPITVSCSQRFPCSRLASEIHTPVRWPHISLVRCSVPEHPCSGRSLLESPPSQYAFQRTHSIILNVVP